jgi:hypothetical protein
MCSTRSCHRTGLFWYSRRKTSRPGADLSPTIADDVAGRVAVGPHPRKVVFPLVGVVPPVGPFIPPPR